ncbi:MAG: RNA polymerase sigma factor [Bacteroidales bacterium]|nr:RNA polymerase sigma factor [Bacteroidales bacterium]
MDNDKLIDMLSEPSSRDAAFRLLMQHYGRRLYWHIRRIVVSHDDAEDALQEAFLKIYSSISSLRSAEKLVPWLYRVATNEALRCLRSKTRFFQSIDDLSPALTDKLHAESFLDSDAAEVRFQQALLSLPTSQRVAFNMRYYDDLPYEQIAEITGKSVASLKTNYHYATLKIKDYLENSDL